MKMPDLEKLKKLQLEEKTATRTFGRFFAQPLKEVTDIQ